MGASQIKARLFNSDKKTGNNLLTTSCLTLTEIIKMLNGDLITAL